MGRGRTKGLHGWLDFGRGRYPGGGAGWWGAGEQAGLQEQRPKGRSTEHSAGTRKVTSGVKRATS